MTKELEELRKDFASIKGIPFKNFFCPILHKDEETNLSKGHIINEKFPNATKTTIWQREDVDNFYGSHIENDFIKLKFSDYSFEEIMLDNNARRQVKPNFSINGNPIELHPEKPDQELPPNQSRIKFRFGEDKIFRTKPALESLGISPQAGAEWEGQWQIDPRFVITPALIKAAHLTLFHLIGYKYALSYVGRFIGYDILGKIFLQNRGKSHTEIQENYKSFFKSYINMINPVNVPFRGTLEDNLVVVCASNGVVWGRVVCVYLGTKHLPQMGVMIPISATSEVQDIFHQFLLGRITEFDALICQYRGSLLFPHPNARRQRAKWSTIPLKRA